MTHVNKCGEVSVTRMSEREFQLLCARSPKVAAKATLPKATATPKYRNVKVYVYADGFVSYGEKAEGRGRPIDILDSTKEYDRWNELQLLERAGKISGLKRQEKIVIQEAVALNNASLKEIAYKADFVYNEANAYVVEDVKPFDRATQKYKLTKDFTLKWKLLQAKYPHYTFRIY